VGGVNEHLGAYVSVVAWLWLASVGVPVPEDIAMLTAGYLCHEGYANPAVMVPVAVVGLLCGDMFIYALGRHWGADLLAHRWTRRLATASRVKALQRRFLDHQIKTVVVGRFLPGLRSLVFLTAGAVRMSPWKFLLANGSAALVSAPAFIALGYLFTRSFTRLEARVTQIEHIVVVIVGVVAVAWLLWHTYARSARAREARRLLAENSVEPAETVAPMDKHEYRELSAAGCPGGEETAPKSHCDQT
jgi:membrane protein DedA with SNARE-associated domain